MKPTRPRPEKDNTRDGPRPREGYELEGGQIPLNLADYQVSFDKNQFDQVVRAHGIKMIHQRAIPDPRGMASRGDNRDVLDIRPQDSDGYIYKNVGEVTAFFSNNSKDTRVQDIGDISFSSAYLTFQRVYDDGVRPLYVKQGDRFYIRDIELQVLGEQRIEANVTGTDRLQFPVVEILELIDSNGVWYDKNDYQITAEGDIKWLTQKRPGSNVANGRGTVYSVVYLYTPFFVVDRILHEIRLAKITDGAALFTGEGEERRTERMPYQALVLRENLFREKFNNSQTGPQHSARMVNSPPQGMSMGPQGMPTLNNNFNSIQDET